MAPRKQPSKIIEKPVIEEPVDNVINPSIPEDGTILEEIEEIIEGTKEVITEATSDIEELIDENVEDIKDIIEDKVEDIKDDVEDIIEDIKEFPSELINKIKELEQKLEWKWSTWRKHKIQSEIDYLKTLL